MKKGVTSFLCLLLLLATGSQAQYTCFYGNLHAHTGYSDGESTPDTALAYARDAANIDIQALTDHNNGGVDYTISPANYLNLRLVSDAMTVPGVFVALAGFEIGNMGPSGFGHLNVYETDLSPYFNAAGDLNSCYSWINSKGCPAQFNHPAAGDDNNFNNLYFSLEYEQTMDLMEVLNGSYSYEDNYFKALDNGWRIGAAANQDNHGRDWGNRVNSTGNIPLTGVWADTLTKASVLEALQARRTTAMEVSPAGDRIQLLLSVDGRFQGDRYIKREGTVDITVSYQASSALKKLYLYTNGIISDSLNVISTGNQLTWQLSKTLGLGSNYLLAKAVQADEDRAWTSPVFVEVISQNSINNFSGSQVATWPTPVRLDARLVFVPLEGAQTVKAAIYDLSGNRIRELAGEQPDQPINWDGKDQAGRLVPNGVYVIRLEQKSATETRTYLGKTMVSR